MIIGLSGYAGSGKTFIANHLVRNHGFTSRKFALPLKNMLQSFLYYQGVTHEMVNAMIEGNLKEVPSPLLNGATPRYAMQTLGTDWGRALICENLWCDAAMRGLDTSQRTVFDDVRFDNEADAIRCAGGVVIRICRSGVGPVNGHISEELPWSDNELVNDGTPLELVGAILRTTQSSA